MWVILAVTLATWIAETVSPPPMIEIAPLLAATAWAILMVPREKGSSSKTPIGPFHTMVLAFLISAEKSAMLFGPMSKPICSAGMGWPLSMILVCAAASALPAII